MGVTLASCPRHGRRTVSGRRSRRRCSRRHSPAPSLRGTVAPHCGSLRPSAAGGEQRKHPEAGRGGDGGSAPGRCLPADIGSPCAARRRPAGRWPRWPAPGLGVRVCACSAPAATRDAGRSPAPCRSVAVRAERSLSWQRPHHGSAARQSRGTCPGGAAAGGRTCPPGSSADARGPPPGRRPEHPPALPGRRRWCGRD